MESNILIEQSLGQVTKLITCSYIVTIQLTSKLVCDNKILRIIDKKRIARQNNRRKKAK